MTPPRTSRKDHSLFAVTAPGLEPVTALELERLGLGPARPLAGGVAFRGSTRALYRANLQLRTATRVLVRVARVRAASFAELDAGVRAIDWDALLPPDQPIALRVSSHASRLYHTGAIAERLAAAVGRPRAPTRDDDDARASVLETTTSSSSSAASNSSSTSAIDAETARAPALLLARIVRDRCSLSLDSSGAPLHRRGYRQALARAPVRETIAAGLLLASGWRTDAALVDPFCGSGTLVIEAALLRRGRPPGEGRRFAFMDQPGFNRGLWASVRGEAARDCSLSQSADAPILAGDRDEGAVAAAVANAARAGVGDELSVARRSLSGWRAAEELTGFTLAGRPPGWIVSNPPYGRRISRGRDLRSLYARLGQLARARFSGWGVALLCPDAALARATGLPLESGARVTHGGLRATFWLGAVP